MASDYMRECSIQQQMNEVIQIRTENPEGVVALCKDIIECSGENFMYGKAFGEYYVAEAYYRLGRKAELVDHAIGGITIQKAYGFYELEARSYNLLGVFFVNTGDYQSAMRYYLTGAELAKKYEMHHMLKIFYNNFGDLYLRLKEYEKAIFYFNQTKVLIDEHSDQMMTKVERELTCVRYSNLIDAYLCIGKLDKALATSRELMSTISESYYRNHPSMFYCILTRLNYAKGKKQQGHSSAKLFLNSVMEKTDLTLLSDIYLPMGEFFIEEGLLEEAKMLLDYLMSLTDEFSDPYQMVEFSKIAIHYYKTTEDHERLFVAYEQYYQANLAYELAMRTEKQKNIKIQLDLYEAIQNQHHMMEKNRELERMSEHDALTGLANRYSINKYCERMFQDGRKKHQKFGMIIVDIDYFKEFNDTYGHVEGDRCICAVAHAIETTAKGFLSARFGGDEFLVMTLNHEDDEMKEMAELISQSIQRLKIEHKGSKSASYVTVSQGIVNCIPTENDSVLDYIHMADIELYKVKKEKRNAFRFYADSID